MYNWSIDPVVMFGKRAECCEITGPFLTTYGHVRITNVNRYVTINAYK